MAYNGLGAILQSRGRIDEAIAQYQKAIAIDPRYAEARFNLALALYARERVDEAIAQLQQAVEIQPDFAEAQGGLGAALVRRGRLDEAIAHYRKALEIDPDSAIAHANLGNVFLNQGRPDKALEHFRKIVELSPESAGARNNLGVALAALGRFDHALAQFRKALQLQPDCVEARKNLAWLRATCPQASLRNGGEAIEHARRADQLCGSQRADVLDALAAAYAEAGRFSEALSTARKALDLATRQKAQAMADALRTRIALYEVGKPYHQPLSASAPAKP
jgi:superkiller protein 3